MMSIEGTEIWAQCDCCKLKMFAGFTPMTPAEGFESFRREGWQMRGKYILCDYCAAQSKPVLRVV